MFKTLLSVYLSLSIVLLFAHCSNRKPGNVLKGVEIHEVTPFIGEHYYQFYQFGNLMIYKTNDRSDTVIKKVRSTSDTETIFEDSIHKTGWKTQYFVYCTDSSYGYRFDPQNRNINERLNVDSTLERINGSNTFEKILTLKPDSIIWTKRKTEVKEVYSFPATESAPKTQANFSFSRRFGAIDFSFNRKLDSVKQLKLFRVELIFDSFYSKKDDKVWQGLTT